MAAAISSGIATYAYPHLKEEMACQQQHWDRETPGVAEERLRKIVD
jgi:hypothetical protein